ncbi:MAG: hypothetical protein J3Q66DRAFT_417917 [Benniella sp.]|nr:MAG: hypothetical protein J3Q66DRAFT_417917 [Benniella sp.]
MSQRISTLDPNCIASNGPTLYAHAVINIGGSQNIVLLKSNAIPSSLTDVSWSVVSTISQNKLYILQGLASIKSFICHVDNQGVFTILSSSSKSFAADQAPSQPRGYQYDPANGWSNVDVADGYKWSIVTESTMFTLNNQLIQVYNKDIVSDTITVAILDKTTRTFVPQNATWSLPSTSGKPNSFTVKLNSLYILSSTISGPTAYLNILPLKSVAPPAASEFTVIPAPNIKPSCPLIPNAGTLETSVLGSSYYVFCSDTGRQRNYLVTYDGKTFGAPVPANTSIHSPESFIPIDASGGQPPWAFMNSGGTIYSLSLTGNTGAWQQAPYKINATGLSGAGSNGTPDSGSPGGSSGDNSSSNDSGGISQTVLVALIVCGVLVVIIGGPAIWKCIRKRRKVKVDQVDTPSNHYPHPPQQQQLQQQQQQHQVQYPSGHYHPTYPQRPFEAPAPEYTTAPIVYEIKGDMPISSSLPAPALVSAPVSAMPVSAPQFIPTSPIATIPQTSVPQRIQNVQGYQEYPQGIIGYQQHPRPGGPQGDGHEPIPTSSTLYLPGPQGPLHDTGSQIYPQ